MLAHRQTARRSHRAARQQDAHIVPAVIGARAPRAVARHAARANGAPEISVVCVGEALFDFIADQTGLPRGEVASWTPYAGGAPCNVATCLARLGVPTMFVSALGRDERGEQLMAVMAERGVDVSGVQRTDAPTRDVYVTRDDSGDREFAGFGLPSDQYCDCFIEAGQLPVASIQGAKVLVLGTLGLACPVTRSAMEAAVRAAKQAGCLVFIDVNWRPVFWPDVQAAKGVIRAFVDEADIVKISDADLEYLYDMQIEQGLQDPCSVAQLVPMAKGVLVTAGGDGAAYCFEASPQGQASGFVPVFDIKVVDTTGAGDAFTAGFIYKLLEAGDLGRLAADAAKLKQAVQYAAATGALTCAKPGAIGGQPTHEEVDRLVAASRV